ncbi:hypothetical protein [Nocardia caishijiensis]|uniref:Excreted virulence factor EspC (Type VII ESX diderm) n=1 Tax=Nocardia caishijiensis TaxID=184756 RepID=A0ABQ6YKB4_9NOCA|nr:hypothetical protein [Nocardia caishijiensis]KAF0846223.1 hypothetical protein FNL39_105134 [Nocardia caishijiensis]
MADELKVAPEVLIQAAQGITGIISELSEIGVKETASSGRGFALLTMSGLEAGKAAVQKGFEEFTERWSWGVRYLVQSGNSIAEAVGLAAGRYYMMEQQGSDTFKQMYTHLLGNPHLSSAEIKARTWGETLADNPINMALNPDYTAESFEDAAAHADKNWQVVQAVGPQALANLSTLDPYSYAKPGDDGLPDAGWNTQAAERAAEILNPPG